MGERSEYTPGTFCWSELSSSDQAASKAFYSALLGWQANDVPVGDGQVYSLMQLDGRDVAAIASQPAQQRDAGVPSLWNSYVSVQSADDAAARAQDLGASVHAPAFDVLDSGRMAVLQDPQGAFVMLWEPRAHAGAALVNAPGALVWNELQSPDLDASASFYSDLFGWSIADAPGMEPRYLSIKNGEANNGGMRTVEPPGAPPSWLVYYGCEDLDASLTTLHELGGRTIAGPMDIRIARLAVVQDPQGAVFALYAGQFES